MGPGVSSRHGRRHSAVQLVRRRHLSRGGRHQLVPVVLGHRLVGVLAPIGIPVSLLELMGIIPRVSFKINIYFVVIFVKIN